VPRALLAFLILAAPCLAQKPGRVEGRVVSTTGQPVPKATVRFAGTPQNGPYVEVTSSEGRFAVENIAPGRYTATAQRPGFTPARNSAGGTAQLVVEVAAGETKSGVEIRLTPLGVVSGTVTDSDGDPVPSAQVRLVRYAYAQGRLILRSAMTGNGDDRGMFRLLNVQPGRYYVSASGGLGTPTQNEIRGLSAREGNLPTYYPNAPDLRGAIPITVGPAEVGNLNLRLRRGATYSIRGKMVDAGGAPASGQLTVFEKGAESAPQGITTQTREGGFLVGGLAPGDYTIIVRGLTQPAGATRLAVAPAPALVPPTPATAATLVGRLDANIATRDLDNVTIRLATGAEVTGRLTIDSGADISTLLAQLPAPPAGAQNAALRNLSVVLTSVEGPTAQINGQVNADGTFRMANIPPLKRLLQIAPLPPAAYIKSVRFSGQDITNLPLDLSTGSGGVLDIVIGTKGGAITATPRDSKGETPQAGAGVSIWPRVPNLASPSGGVKLSAPAASFRAQGLAPGEYYVAAWENFVQEFAGVPEFLARFTALATKVTVAEGETVSVEPKLISREAMEKETAQFP
jgi:sarcosine oxidase gamma subunit